MKRNTLLYSLMLAGFAFTACQKNDIAVAPANLNPVSNVQYTLNGDTAVLSWALPSTGTPVKIVIDNGSGSPVETAAGATSYKFGIVETNKDYKFTLKATDGQGNLSLGEVLRFNRSGAAPVKNLSAVQNNNGVLLSWAAPASAVSKIQAKMGSQTVDISSSATSYQFSNVPAGSYTISVVTYNSANQVSNTVYLPFRVGATAVAYLGTYADSAALLSNGDDDEVAAAKWLFQNYSKSEYISFNEIKNGTVDLSQFRVLWWNFDVSTGHALPAASTDAVVVNRIKQYYKNGGGLLLNQYAMQYLWTLGRMTQDFFLEFGDGAGFNNPDSWGIGINPNRKHDKSSHPLFKDIAKTIQGDNRVTFPVIGPGWKENHNAVIVRIPEFYNLLPNDKDDSFGKFESENNAEWLGVWDGIGDLFMIGVAELKPKDDFQGSSIFIGIGGIEWNQNSGTNIHQGNVEKLYKNALDYLKTK